MLYEVTEGVTYHSPSGVPFLVIGKAAHGQDCSLGMVIYKNLTATKDYAPGKIWVIEETLFLKTFKPFEEG